MLKFKLLFNYIINTICFNMVGREEIEQDLNKETDYKQTPIEQIKFVVETSQKNVKCM